MFSVVGGGDGCGDGDGGGDGGDGCKGEGGDELRVWWWLGSVALAREVLPGARSLLLYLRVSLILH